MPSPNRRFNPRDVMGFSGQPLNTPAEGLATPESIKRRFAEAGQEAFLPYTDPWATLATAQDIRQSETDLAIADAENKFVAELDGISKRPRGLETFISDNPLATFSPMVQTYQKLRQTTERDPYESMVAREGAEYLDAYRIARQSGTDPTLAFAQVRDEVAKRKGKASQDEEDELFYVEQGGDLDDFAALKEKGANRAQMLDFIRKKGKPLTTTEASKLSQLQADLETARASMEGYDDEDAYTEDIVAVYGRKPATEQEWQDAYFALQKQKVGPAQKAYEDYLGALQEQGKRIPGAQGTPKAPSPPAAPVPQPIAPTQTPPPATPPAKAEDKKPSAKPGITPLDQIRKILKP